jgi:mannan endo-1,4-beta-mannosidase
MKSRFIQGSMFAGLVVLFILTPILNHTSAQSLEPPTKQVLAFFESLAEHQDKSMLVGQFGYYGDGETPTSADKRLGQIHTESGKDVAFTGADYEARSVTRAETNTWVIQQWQQGRIVMLSWHMPNPFAPDRGVDCRLGDDRCDEDDLQQLLTSGNPAYDFYQYQLTQAADDLTVLRYAGVVVVWRPFHEMNGGWFWWHQQPKATFIALWQHMYKYFTEERGLNNLLWAYSPNNVWDTGSTGVDFYYPGAEYVDLVGLDIYYGENQDTLDLDKNGGSYQPLVALNKPMGLFEFGPSPANGCCPTQFDYTKLLRDLRTKYPKMVFFQAWEWIYSIPENAGVKALMNDPAVITLTDLPKWSVNTGQAVPAAAATIVKTQTPTPSEATSATVTPFVIEIKIDIRIEIKSVTP